MLNRESITESALLNSLCQFETSFAPLRLKEATAVLQRVSGGDAIVEISWGKKQFSFVVSAKNQFSPKILQSASDQIRRKAEQLNCLPLIVTPFLSEEQLRVLESQQVSGVDLCGNGIVIVPGEILMIRTGKPNQYPSSTPIRNVYRGTSSIVARSFLLRAEYESVQELCAEIENRGGAITLSTVSKVCSSLSEELIVERLREGRKTKLRLLQADKLLERLGRNFEPPAITRQVAGKLSLNKTEFEKLLLSWQSESEEKIIRTGATSSDCYSMLVREPIERLYCTDIGSLLSRLGDSFIQTDRFSDYQFLETTDETVYFDSRDEFNASPLQVYLELTTGDKRERETAVRLRTKLLEDANSFGING